MIKQIMKQTYRPMNKKGFMARDWVISLILFSGFFAMAILMVSSLATSYDNTSIIDEDVQESFDKFEETTDIASDAFDVANEKGSFSLVGALGLLFNASFSIFSLIFNSIALASQQLFSLGEYVGLPSEVSNILFPMLISILTVIIVFVIISTTTRRDF